MQRVRLIHWNAGEARARIDRLAALGWRVEYDPLTGPPLLAALRDEPPAAFVIDLTRLPSHGREVAVVLRRTKATRMVPLVFVGGVEEKVARVNAMLPDATFTTWERIGEALHAALRAPPRSPIVPRDTIGAPGTPLWKKLGVTPGARVRLLDAPDGFEVALAPLPERVRIVRGARGAADLAIWFVRSARVLGARIGSVGRLAPSGQLWIAWPKQTARVATDVTQNTVRAAALRSGLVDYKVCSIDATWSGLKFSQKR